MVEGARRVLREVDLVAWMVDAGGVRAEDRVVAEMLRPLRVPVVLVVNKVDGAAARQVGAVAREGRALLPVAETYRISAQTGLGVDALGAGLIARLPEGPRYYPEGVLTDASCAFPIRV